MHVPCTLATIYVHEKVTFLYFIVKHERMGVALNKMGVSLTDEYDKLDAEARLKSPEERKKPSFVKVGIFWIIVAVIAIAIVYFVGRNLLKDLVF